MRLACVQSNVFLGNPAWNAEAAEARLAQLSQDKVELAVFPEAYLTGYCFDSAEAASAAAIPRAHSSLVHVRQVADKLGIVTLVGFAEREEAELYNTAALFEPGVEPRYYRKCHLPELGLDHFVGQGNELQVFETKLGRIGILICFDQRLPEPARVLALKGAELICLPTNWPVGAENSADVMCIARAAENRVFYAACNRVGTENGFEFIGRSKIIDPVGKVLASAGAGEKTILADIDLAEARKKRTVNVPGKYEMSIFASRRTELYGALMDPSLNVANLG
jgi:5-aminopentanamidase